MAPEISDSNLETRSLSKAPSLPACVYVTIVAGNGDYYVKVLELAKALKKTNSSYPLMVAVLPDVPEEHRRILVDQGCIMREIEPLYPPENPTQFVKESYSKIRVWKFQEFSKMIYLDGDMQVMGNIDHLFDLPDGYLHAVMDCFCEKKWNHTPQSEIGYCQHSPDKVQWPAESGRKPDLYFNADMFVFEPSIPTYHELLNTLKTTPPTPFAEQDFLNMFFKDSYRPIPPIYNLKLAMIERHPENIDLGQVKVAHYCAAAGKKYVEREGKKPVLEWLRNICGYNDEVLDHNNQYSSSAAASEAEAEAEEDVRGQPFLEALWEAVRCCPIEDINLQLLLASLSEEAGCFSIEDLSLQRFLEALWEAGCDFIDDLCVLTDLFRGRFVCGGFVYWF